MKSIVDKSNLEYLLRICRSYTPAQRDPLAAEISKDSVADIKMNGSAFMDNNAHAYDALNPDIFGTLV